MRNKLLRVQNAVVKLTLTYLVTVTSLETHYSHHILNAVFGYRFLR